MMTVTTCGFHGTLRPNQPAPYTVRCVTCHVAVMVGDNTVHLDAFTHQCHDTSSERREYEITWETPVTEVEAPVPFSAEAE